MKFEVHKEELQKQFPDLKEIWKKIDGYEYYLVSNFGNVKSLDKMVNGIGNGTKFKTLKCGKILKPVKINNGYLNVTLIDSLGIKKQFSVHRLVAKAFIVNKENKRTVNHINGIKHDNNVNNLEWATHSEQLLHSYRKLGNVAYVKGKFGGNSPISKKVLQKTMDGKLVKKWDSGINAVREGGFHSGAISRACNGIRKSHKGFKWEFVN